MRLFLTLIALWAILVPTLCLAGAFAHACDGCEDEYACAHEEECAEDPCSVTMIRPVPGTGVQDIGLCTASITPWPPILVSTPLAAPVAFRPPEALLPVPESDLPLLS